MTRQYGQFEKDDFYVKFTLDIIANKYTDGRMDGWTDGRMETLTELQSLL